MIVSLLIPSRKRPERLTECIRSFYQTADNPSDVEALVRLDLDDLEGLEAAVLLQNEYPTMRVFFGHRPETGYAELHTLYNELHAMSTGEFVWILNDDVTMHAQGWDTILREYSGYMVCINTQSDQYTGNHFPLVHRDIPRKIEFFALFPEIDVMYENMLNGTPFAARDSRLRVEHHWLPRQHNLDGLENYNMRGTTEQHLQVMESRRMLLEWVGWPSP